MLKSQSFHFIAPELQKRSGITLNEDKTYLLESRLQPIARQYGYDDVDALLSALSARMDEAIMHEIVQVMTTNETMFFRDNKPFERFTDVILPEIRENHPERKHIRIWSSACSTGQEAYTLAICLQEQASKYQGYRFEIFGSDLCRNAVKKAQDGIYSQFEVQRGMPIQLLVKYFKQLEGNQWQINDETKKLVRFEEHNLLESPRRFGEFDVVFCRNVLIYFNEEIKRKVVANLESTLRPPGYVLLGSAESLMGITDKLKMAPGHAGLFKLT